MKPLNLDNRPCSPISSNCVIWQGPDIPCIKLCTGDTVSDIVAKLGTELCDIMDQLNVSNYDLSCLNITACPPENFQALIELLITRVCELNGIPQDQRTSSTCPECVVSVAPCFIQGTQTTMNLVDYVNMIASRVCSILDEIASINNELTVVNETLIDLQNQIDNLPTYTLPSIPADCILGSGTYPLDQILNALMNDDTLGYCSLLNSTGTPAQITTGVLSQCIADGDASLASLAAGDSPVQSFSTYYAGSWVNNPSLTTAPTIANAIKNIWIAICDIYTGVTSFGIGVQDTNTIDLTYTGGVISARIVDTGWVALSGFDHMPLANRPECRRIGSQVHFRGTAVIPLQTPGNPSSYVPWSSTAYNSVSSPTVYSGTGGVTINTNGSLLFNLSASVVPSSVVDSLTDFDNTYSLGYVVATRQIDLNSGSPLYGTALSALLGVGITSTKQLYVSVLKDLEYTSTAQQAAQYGSSHLRYITSKVTAGEEVPVYTNAATTIHSAPAPGGTVSVDVAFGGGGALPTYPFSCDAGEETQIGGFSFRLDGLIAYLDPCNTDIKTNKVCP